MECEEFLRSYSDYRDGLLPPSRFVAFEAHLEACESCSRYDRILSRGIEILNSLPPASSSPDFLPRLQHRLYHVDDEIPLTAGRPGGAAALVAVAAVGLLALTWMPFATRLPVEVELPAVTVQHPARDLVSATEEAGSLFRHGPFVLPASEALAVPGGGPLHWDAPAWRPEQAFQRPSALQSSDIQLTLNRAVGTSR